ncbi:MAG: tRNA pseudouridine synthase B [Candidatus Nomurabacteria bacterium GW2011_GWA2_40_9]|uniref:tRNA pseudouridine(55) synthase n=1 Tax=Candidatus Nomurabacteria bacterium GW2011_GWA2_40_9 TaxID=1618734 RepID=A0A0G0TW14_9BACT|nr:MAG: tRNA pseudouridine synthase B [Candidatus Nomurabacteria bacterium GW2011_GWA2_40_9]
MKSENKNIILLNKKEGETPLSALSLFRDKHKIYKDIPMTYAGRLDPMASGLLIILAGEECKNKEKYLNLDKEYEFEILFGFQTDTYDILGKITKTHMKPTCQTCGVKKN